MEQMVKKEREREEHRVVKVGTEAKQRYAFELALAQIRTHNWFHGLYALHALWNHTANPPASFVILHTSDTPSINMNGSPPSLSVVVVEMHVYWWACICIKYTLA